ncbi:MAG: hypothetical protein J3R72DRAFT_53677 [Linnemannia gamsii]|nr:MAG: hypothetical protein J3R72DRAFT_53677 [Linnemannia gamsii]
MVEPINSSFKGATYFLALENMLQAKAVDNYESRGMDLARLKAVMQKREGWMDTFRGSEHKLFAEWIRISYNYAKTITEYLVRGGLVGWKLNMLMTSWEQLRDIEVEMTHMHGKIQVMSRMSREMQVDMSRILREMKDNMRRTLYEMQVDLHRMMREMHVETRSRMLREKQADLNRIPHNQTKAAMEYLIKEEFDRLKLDMMGTNSEQLRENLVEFMLKTVDILDKKRERSTMEEVATSKTNKTTRMLDLSSQEVDHDNTTLPSTPPNRSPSPIPVPTEFPGSPLEVYTVRQKNNPFQVCEGDDEEDNSADAREENDILLADTKDQACQFSAMLNLSRREVDHDNTTLPSTPPNRSPSPIPIPTEFPGSPLEVYAARQMNNPFQVCEDEDEEDSSADSGEENDILLADNRDQSCQFSAMLDEVDVATGFQSLFTAVKKKTVYIHDIDEALARCGVILLSKKGTELQTLHFGETTLVKMREKALAKWQNAEATAGQNQVRAWLGITEMTEKSHASIY